MKLPDELHRDHVTGFASNRDGQLWSLVEDAHRRCEQQGVRATLLLVHIDYFWAVNRQFGFGQGDDVLREFARRLSACLTAADTLGHFAGDQFWVILDGADAEVADAVIGKLSDRMNDPFVMNQGRTLALTASTGYVQLGIAETAHGAIQEAEDIVWATKCRRPSG